MVFVHRRGNVCEQKKTTNWKSLIKCTYAVFYTRSTHEWHFNLRLHSPQWMLQKQCSVLFSCLTSRKTKLLCSVKIRPGTYLYTGNRKHGELSSSAPTGIQEEGFFSNMGLLRSIAFKETKNASSKRKASERCVFSHWNQSWTICHLYLRTSLEHISYFLRFGLDPGDSNTLAYICSWF